MLSVRTEPLASTPHHDRLLGRIAARYDGVVVRDTRAAAARAPSLIAVNSTPTAAVAIERVHD